MKVDQIWQVEEGDGPLVATAIHDGHAVRADLVDYLELNDAERLREEDPYTREWVSIASTRIVGLRSRFEVDLNRPRDKAVYIMPEDSWGLAVWKRALPAELIKRSLDEYDYFYAEMRTLLKEIEQKNGGFLVYDLHSYNHRRNGPNSPAADPEANPQVNIGTGSMDRKRWGSVVDAFIEKLRDCDFPGGKLDVRENVKFRGGNWGRWIHENFPDTGMVLSIEVKKFFMDEWTGARNDDLVRAIGKALQRTVSSALEEWGGVI